MFTAHAQVDPTVGSGVADQHIDDTKFLVYLCCNLNNRPNDIDRGSATFLTSISRSLRLHPSATIPMALTLEPRFLISSVVSSTSVLFLAVIAYQHQREDLYRGSTARIQRVDLPMAKPAFANALAIALPMPRPEPVMSATFPWKALVNCFGSIDG